MRVVDLSNSEGVSYVGRNDLLVDLSVSSSPSSDDASSMFCRCRSFSSAI